MDNKDIRRIKEQRKKDIKSGNPIKSLSLLKEDVEHQEPPIGEKYHNCECCGIRFEQVFYKKTNRYSNYKLCPRCRKGASNNDLTTVSTVKYVPFPWQIEAEKLLDSHKYLILACGARTGKDRFSNMMLIKYVSDFINENRHIRRLDLVPSFLVWVIAPTLDMAKQNYRELKNFLPKNWIVHEKDGEMTLELLTGGIIEVKSAYDEESLVGVGLDFCTITEADRIKNLEAVWANISMRLISPGRGRECDRKGSNFGCGKCVINSSPTKRGYLYEMWKWGNPSFDDEYDPDFASMNLSSLENPFVREEMERVKHTKYGDITQYEFLQKHMSKERFARDILGQFVDDSGSVFSEFRSKCVIDVYSASMGMDKEARNKFSKEWQEPSLSHTYRIGYDPATGSSADDPAVVVRDLSTNRIVFAVSLYGKSYDQQYDEISYISRRYNYANCCWLRTGHTAIENQLAKRGVLEVPLNEQGGKKAEYIQSLERAVQNGDVKVLDDGSPVNQKIIKQMSDYTEKSGKYSNNLEAHDDFVSALYAVYYDYSVQSSEVSGFSALLGGF